MTKEQLEEAKIINDKIKRINSDIAKFSNSRMVSFVSINTINKGSGAVEKSDITINLDTNKKIIKNYYANGMCDEIILADTEMITNGYIESIIRLLKAQLVLFERQFKQI